MAAKWRVRWYHVIDGLGSSWNKKDQVKLSYIRNAVKYHFFFSVDCTSYDQVPVSILVPCSIPFLTSNVVRISNG